jgi:hypothetical protein
MSSASSATFASLVAKRRPKADLMSHFGVVGQSEAASPAIGPEDMGKTLKIERENCGFKNLGNGGNAAVVFVMFGLVVEEQATRVRELLNN